MGNSDHSNPRSKKPATSLTAAAPLWRAFVRDYTNGWPVTSFQPPTGVVRATIDAWSGGRPGPWTRDTVNAWFIDGTQPGAAHAIDPDGLLYDQGCGGYRVNPLKAELGPTAWDGDVADWMRRAARGPGTMGQYDSKTAYFWSKTSWGGPIMGSCAAPRQHDAAPKAHNKHHKHKHPPKHKKPPKHTPPPAQAPAAATPPPAG